LARTEDNMNLSQTRSRSELALAMAAGEATGHIASSNLMSPREIEVPTSWGAVPVAAETREGRE
jgi:hypothetical protein